MTSRQADTRYRVLIVDDEPANIHVLAEALKGDYEIRFATDATRALEIASSIAFDVILLDVVMPGADGFTVLRKLKSEPATRNVPVIFVTAMNETGDEERGFALGAVDYISKPVKPAIVRARVRTHIELKRQRDLLENFAFIDGLTGIANRRRLDSELALRWNASQRNGQPLLLMLLDVDHFKQFNDTYGHGPGDDCLRQVAATLATTFARSEDLVARYGGEEFALIVPGGDGTTAPQRVLQAVAALKIPHDRSSAADHVTVSVGAIELLPQAGGNAQDALKTVDQLLYEAKQGGRKQAVFFSAIDNQKTIVHAREVSP